MTHCQESKTTNCSGLYDDGHREYNDNAERFGFFSRACIQLCRDIKFQPDIMHCNDWQTALIAPYLKLREMGDPFFRGTASVLTIHNIGHQGVFHPMYYRFLGLGDQNFTSDKFENYKYVNFLKGSIFYADAVTTVSPSYAEEILSSAGGSGINMYLERRRADLAGILNGADYEHWNPETDPLIPANYSVKNLSGKSICKRYLQRTFDLDDEPNAPVIGIVTRFAEQKGHQLLMPMIKDILNNMVVQFVILGDGEKYLEDFFGGLPAEYPGRVGAWIGFSNERAHLIEAGSDFFIMPSLYEPCGLNQIYSMKYGTLPIVRAVGGLKDTVEQYDESKGTGTGFIFYSLEPRAIYYTVGWAVSTYFDRPNHMASMIHQAMKTCFSWENSAREYEKLYKKAIARRASWV